MYDKENLKNCLAPRRTIYIFNSLQLSTNGKPIENFIIREATPNLVVEKFICYLFPEKLFCQEFKDSGKGMKVVGYVW